MSSVMDQSGARRVVLDGCRRTARHRFTRWTGWFCLAVAGTVLLLGPLRVVLVLSLGVAVGLVVAFAALGSIAAVLVHRTGHELVAPPVAVGNRSETTHDHVQVHSVQRLRGGDVRVALSWQARYRIELDPLGLPLGIEKQGRGSCAWTIPAALVMDGLGLEQLQGLIGSDLTLVEQALEQQGGTTVVRRVLASPQGVVLDLRC
jgi:hypothetical protein